VEACSIFSSKMDLLHCFSRIGFVIVCHGYCIVDCDEDINTNYAFTLRPLGPLTRTHARQLNHHVSSFLNSRPSYLDNGDTCTLVLPRNDGEDQQGKVRLHSECDATPTLQRVDCI
jgi:hypothetical protein